MAGTPVYFNLPSSALENRRAGYKNQAWITPRSWITTIPPALALDGPGAYEIGTDFVFSEDPAGGILADGFISCYATRHSVTVSGETIGDSGSLSMIWKPKIMIPGDGSNVQSLLETLMNEDLILLVKDASCPGGYLMFGCDCGPAGVSKLTFDGGTTKDGSKGWTMELESNCRLFYNGTITELSGTLEDAGA